MIRTTAAAFSLLTALHAQTYVVDAANGPGAHYTTIAAATAAAPDGATLLVRAGSYYGFSIVGKSMKLLADPGVTVLGSSSIPFSIHNLTSSQSVVLRGLRLGSATHQPAPFTITCNGCQGPILITQCVTAYQQLPRLRVNNCAAVLVRDQQMEGPGAFRLELTNSNVVVESSLLGIGNPAPNYGPGGDAVSMTGGSLQIVDSAVQGGVSFIGPTFHGIAMNGGDLRLLGTTAVNSGFSGSLGAGYGVAGTGAVRHEPSVTFPSGTPFAPGVTATSKVMPRLSATMQGSGAQARLFGPAGDVALIAIALPGPRSLLPGVQDALHVDTATFGGVAIGVLSAGVPLNMSFGAPPPGMRGVRATFQAVTWDGGADLQISNPSFLILP